MSQPDSQPDSQPCLLWVLLPLPPGCFWVCVRLSFCCCRICCLWTLLGLSCCSLLGAKHRRAGV